MPLNVAAEPAGGTLPERKAALRRELLRRRGEMDSAQKAARDRKLCGRLCQLWRFREAEIILGYYPIGSEADIRPALLEALRRGKGLALPRCGSQKGEMDFYLVDSLEGLRPGAFGVPEPDPARCAALSLPARGPFLCLVPGLAFDRAGHRLGYGKGCYDRFLPRFPGGAVGICYEALLLDRLPRGRYDRAIPAVLTEDRFLDFRL
ncbi:MAG: 5-formyltetrahydrofolate cyclo-ligase [Oscillospiraceae bacterium]|nr:5-formyltetrahydrofolate cyclo-ligase [Oscillospiraceae bacterium]